MVAGCELLGTDLAFVCNLARPLIDDLWPLEYLLVIFESLLLYLQALAQLVDLQLIILDFIFDSFRFLELMRVASLNLLRDAVGVLQVVQKVLVGKLPELE